MVIICDKCNRIMVYEPYFKANICRQCGNMIFNTKSADNGTNVPHSNIRRLKRYKQQRIMEM